MFYKPQDAPFKKNDEVVALCNIYYKSHHSGRKILVFEKGEVLVVNACWFISKFKGFQVNFLEHGECARSYNYDSIYFQLKSEYDKDNFFFKWIKGLLCKFC